MEAMMKATVKRGGDKRLKSVKEGKRDVKKATKPRGGKNFHYPIAETLQWMAEGEKLLEQWGAIKSPGAKRIAGGVSKVLLMLQTLNEVLKT
jgi:hypothetical protein